MRVALDATALLDPTTGVGVFVGEVTWRLAERAGVEVIGYAASWRGRNRLAGALPEGVEVVRRPMAAQPLRQLWLRSDHPTIERWTGPIDVVHGPNFVVPPTRRAAQVVTVHDLTCVRFPEMVTADVTQYPRLIQRAADRGAWIHTVSEFVAAEVRDAFRVDPERVVVVSNGPGELAPDGAGADAATGRILAGGERYLLAIGTVEPRKDLPTLVRAFDLVSAEDPEMRLVLAGGQGWGAAAEALDAAVLAARHPSRIVRLGRVSDQHRGALLRGASVFAYPSLYEGFGLAPLEAMAAGVPVVATNAGALPEVVGDAGLLVPAGDVDALAAELTQVLVDDALRIRLIAAGHRNSERFDWDQTVAELVDLYQAASR